MKKCIIIAVSIALLLILNGAVFAEGKTEEYPSKSIYCIIPWSAGGGTDTTIRGFLKVAEKHVGVSFNASNVTGGGGSVGWTELAAAKADGYTIGALTYDVLTHSAKENPPFFYDDFVCLVGISQYPMVLVVKADAPWDTLDEFVEYARANRGDVNVGIGAIGGNHHQLLTAMENKLDLKFKPVPFEGGAKIIAAILGDNVEMGFINSPEAKNRPDIKVLAQFAKKRHEDLPDAPTAMELGVDIVLGSFRGLGVPKGTPEDRIAFLRQKFTETWNDEEFLSWATKAGASPSYMSGEDFDEMLDAMFPNVKQALEQINR